MPELGSDRLPRCATCSCHLSLCGLLSALLTGGELAFVVGNKTSFELPLQHVANSNIAGRTEVSLEFIAPSDSVGKKPSKGQPGEVAEIRFFVSGPSSLVQGSDTGSNKSDAEDDGVDDVSAAQAFHEAIKEKAELGHVSGDIILSFEEVLVFDPQECYDVDMFPDFLRLRGKTYDYKIVFSSISRLFPLPKDDLHTLFIVRSASLRLVSLLISVLKLGLNMYPRLMYYI